MSRNTHDLTPSNPLSWNSSYSPNLASAGDDEAAADVDEPPDLGQIKPTMTTFERTEIQPIARISSLLTEAIQSETRVEEGNDGNDDDDEGDSIDNIDNTDNTDKDEDADDKSTYESILRFPPQARRRSMASNISIASTAELTSDTGLTSPSRACTPSPPHPDFRITHIPTDPFPKLDFEMRPITSLMPRHAETFRTDATPKPDAPKKRTIQFACGNAPLVQAPKIRLPAGLPTRPQPMVKTPSAQEAPRKPCIKFACPARPSSTQNTPPQSRKAATVALDLCVLPAVQIESPSTPKTAIVAARSPPPPRSPSCRHSKSPVPRQRRPKYLRATSADLTSEASQYHEFASDEAHEEDWVRLERKMEKQKLTIDDVFVKENSIRRLGEEAEEEAKEEEEAELNDQDNENMDDEDLETVQDDEDEHDANDVDGHATDGSDGSDGSGGSDGYHSDEETGFADSDDEDAAEEPFWIAGRHIMPPSASATLSNHRHPSIAEQLSDASFTGSNRPLIKRFRSKPRRIHSRSRTPELPDSTDFVCGTLDEDRPAEEAYISCREQRKRDKLLLIPQDIDPSFPTTEPEDNDDDDHDHDDHDAGHKRRSCESDEHEWVHGKMEDLHHEEARARRRRRDQASPRRYHSPPPRRFTSPPLKARPGVSGRTSPRRTRSPIPHLAGPTTVSPGQNQRPVMYFNRNNVARSLPKPTGMLHQLRNGKRRVATGLSMHHNNGSDMHIRGAIDIVKGLEQKRSRRREKFLAKYCDRARKGQLPERKAVPAGLGAEKMREIGLLMAGKKDLNAFVLSV